MLLWIVIAMFFGGFVGVWMISTVLEWAICKRFFDDPVTGKLVAVISGWLIAGFVAGWTGSRGLGWNPMPSLLLYLPGAFILALMGYRKGMRLRQRSSIDASIFE